MPWQAIITWCCGRLINFWYRDHRSPEMNASPIRSLGALLPLAMSFLGLAMLVVHVALYGFVRGADEGTPARIFQLFMVMQVPIIALFAIKWLPVAPRQTLLVLGLQILAACAAVAAVLLAESLA
jgi:hypothetical protein